MNDIAIRFAGMVSTYIVVLVLLLLHVLICIENGAWLVLIIGLFHPPAALSYISVFLTGWI